MKMPPEKPNIIYYNDPIVGTVAPKMHTPLKKHHSSLITAFSNQVITVPNSVAGTQTVVTVYSLSGKVLRYSTLTKSKFNLQADFALPFGTYLVKMVQK